MSALRQVEELLTSMTRGEKAQVLQWVVRDMGDAHPGIDSRPDVCGGEPALSVPEFPFGFWEQARRLDTGEADLLCAFPTLRAEDLANAWAYVRSSSTPDRPSNT